MTKPYVPYIPEEKILTKITKREAVLLTKLRKYSFGKFLVQKFNNLIIRVEPTSSELVEPDGEINLD